MFLNALLTFVGISLIINSEWRIELYVTGQLTGLESGGVTIHKSQ